MSRALPTIRLPAWLWFVLSPLLFAGIALLLGKDAGWDFQNYHWYNPYALFNGRLDFDLAVAHHATYYNPLIDVPLYLVARHGPAWLGGALLGAFYGVAVTLLGAIAYHVFVFSDARQRAASAVALALLGAMGGGALTAIGSTSNDVPAAIGIFAALFIVVKHFDTLRQAQSDRVRFTWLLMAGICAGASVGLKLTTVVYALGLIAAAPLCARGLRQRATCTVSLGLGMLIGVALFAGYWMARMWAFGRNPLFPYFNQVFHSPLLVTGSYRDPSFLPASAREAWLFPFYFTRDSREVAEWQFRDAHILVAYVLVPLTLLLMAFKQHRLDSIVRPLLATYLFTFAGASYAAWLALFCVYRYAIPLEMLCPTLITAAIALWPLRRPAMWGATLTVLVMCQAAVKVTFERHAWQRRYVQVEVPQVDPHSAVLMAGLAPMAFTIASFPRDIPFWRIDGWLVHMDDHDSGLSHEMHRRVATHSGPLYILFAAYDRVNAINAAHEYGLQLDGTACQRVTSNITAPLYLCRVTRPPAALQIPNAALRSS